MIQPPSEEQLAILWWQALLPGEKDMWRDEAGGTPGVSSHAGILAAWRLYWSRGPQLGGDDLEQVSKGNCPICRRRGFVIGPIALGINLNIECAQLDCRSRFNVVFFSGAAINGHHLPNGATAEPWPSEPEGVRP